LNKPDFLIAGPQKTGTSWLYHRLKSVPGITMPPVKELSFFHEADVNLLINQFNNHNKLWHNYFSQIKNKHVAENMAKQLLEYRKTNFRMAWQQKTYLWSVLFRFIPRNFSLSGMYLYSSLFNRADGNISGDISPLYFALSNEAIKEIRHFFPELKIIFIIRDPVEREWSQLKMRYYRQKKEGSIDDYLKHYNPQCDYKNAFENWERHFNNSHILYMFYDDLVADPNNFFKQLLTFIGSKITDVNVSGEYVLKGENIPLDPTLKQVLFQKNKDQYHFLSQKFGPRFTNTR
jgi:hypothetical protein